MIVCIHIYFLLCYKYNQSRWPGCCYLPFPFTPESLILVLLGTTWCWVLFLLLSVPLHSHGSRHRFPDVSSSVPLTRSFSSSHSSNTSHSLEYSLQISLHFVLSIFIFIFISVLLVCIYVHCVCVWCLWRSEEGIGSLGAGTEMVVSHHVSIGNWTHVLWKSNKCP